MTTTAIHPRRAEGPLLLSASDVYLAREGTHGRLYDRLGAHLATEAGTKGARFAVWAPNATEISVIGDFNDWKPEADPMRPCEEHREVWHTFIPALAQGDRYKYQVTSRERGYSVAKGDPFAFCTEVPPATASRIWDLGYDWGDADWMALRERAGPQDSAMSVYEMQLGSWRRGGEGGDSLLSYRDIAAPLVDHMRALGFTHVELLPIMEHPFYGSWGYQQTGYFAPTARYGEPQDLMYLIDTLHQNGMGVILDWVPSHFPDDEHGLVYFDGTHLFEHQDPRQGFHPHWNSYIFNYGRPMVRSFLLSSALFWLDHYHADALRVDAVASMLYLDYGREDGNWVPNEHGGKENLDAVGFLRLLNEAVYREHPGAQTIAEDSTAWPMVSRPVHLGGLGFGMKWNMGWMHDTLAYMTQDPIHRKYYHNLITFGPTYAFSENYTLSLSHDEVVHGKKSLLSKMPGDRWQQFANLRLMFGYMFGYPGKKLLFMGAEIAQSREWAHDSSLDWELLEDPFHSGVYQWIRDLNHFYCATTALHSRDFCSDGFEWVDCHDSEQSTLSFLRSDGRGACALVVCNFTPVVRAPFRLGIPRGGVWREVLNSDAAHYGGSNQGNLGAVVAQPVASHGRPFSVSLTLPPLSALFFVPEEAQ